jgi:5'-deoxynucleotidase|tara:strand:+ start:788 stop:1405 length:618 start_codon:yes stop_codon:yes gene_type:complete
MNTEKFFEMAHSMSSVHRYSSLRLVQQESVMEHTGFVCLLAYILCEHINKFSGEKIDTSSALQKAVVHDIDEIITGDIPRPTKYYNKETRKAFEKIEKAGVKKVGNNLGLTEENSNFFKNWENSKQGKEGEIIRLCDLASVVFKIREEVMFLSNKRLSPQIDQVMEYIKSFKERIEKRQESQFKNYILDITSQLEVLCNQTKKSL